MDYTIDNFNEYIESINKLKDNGNKDFRLGLEFSKKGDIDNMIKHYMLGAEKGNIKAALL